MKKIYKSIFICGLSGAVILGLTGCGPKDDGLRRDQKIAETESEGVNMGDVATEVLEGEMLSGLPLMIDFNTHKYQYMRNQSIDVFAGYMTVSKSVFEFGAALPHTYKYPNGYYNGPLGESKKLFDKIYHAYFFADNDTHGLPEWKAIAQIVYAYSMQELVDFFGTVPYDDYRALKQNPPLNYLSCEEVYDRILNDLDDAVNVLNLRQPSADALKRIEGTRGGLSNLNWQNWVKFANSIRLRMALNMVKANPGRAQQIAETAVGAGVLTEDFSYYQDGTVEHPLYGISSVWNDSRLGASLLNIMQRLANPLLDVWFSKNAAAIKSASGAVTLAASKGFAGMRQGCLVDPTPKTGGYGSFSKFQSQYMLRSYFKVTEVLFLQAEGALRGWAMGGTAKDFYEKGIKCSFEENGLDNAAYEKYIKLTKAKAIDYRDYYKTENSIGDLTRGVQIGVKWATEIPDGDIRTDIREVQLEQIITQKYIANFPQSAEAWTTFRRTGYPRLFPVPETVYWDDRSFDNELQVRRIPYDMNSSNDELNRSGIETALGGPNNAGTRIWWDVQTEQRDAANRIIPVNF